MSTGRKDNQFETVAKNPLGSAGYSIPAKIGCFDPFPCPADGPDSLKDKIRAKAEALDALRKRVLADQVSAVAAILSGAQVPLTPRDVTRNFKGKRAASITPVLDALAGIGLARRLQDGRYAA